MKKFSFMFMFLFLYVLVSAPAIVKADVLWEPFGDSFYKNFDGTKYVEKRTYIVNSGKGYAVLYKSPDSRTVEGYLENGEEFFAYWVYETEGHKWGQSSSDGNYYICLDDCYVKYDHQSFSEEFKDSISYINYDLDARILKIEDGALCYEYPGADVLFTFNGGCDEAYVDGLFLDENGDEWAYFTYVYGRRCFWINLDSQKEKSDFKLSVANPELYAKVIPTEKDLKASAKLDVTAPTKDRFTLFIILFGTCIIVCFASFSIRMMLKNKSLKSDR